MSTRRPILRSNACTAVSGSSPLPVTGVTPNHAPHVGTSFAETAHFFFGCPLAFETGSGVSSAPSEHAVTEAAVASATLTRASLPMAAHYNDTSSLMNANRTYVTFAKETPRPEPPPAQGATPLLLSNARS